MPASLDGRVALVTGGAGGLGRAIAGGLADAGACVTVQDFRSEAAAAAVRALPPGKAMAVAGDVGGPDDCERAVAETVAAFGALHILINNAGVGMGTIRPTYHRTPVDSFAELTLADWERFIRVNATGPFLMTRAAMPQLRRAGWGRVINVTTSLSTMLRRGFLPYGCSKAAFESMSAMWAEELGGSGITVNIVVPGGPTDTGMVSSENDLDRGVLLRPTVMVPPIRWLCSRAADGVNGRRFIGAAWDIALPDGEAAERAGAPIGWPGIGIPAVWPTARAR